MKRILSVTAMVTSILFLVTGTGILLLQNALKSSYLFGVEWITVYLLTAVIQLILTGIPCAALAAINLAGSHGENRTFSLLTCIYCSANLISHDFLMNSVSNFQAIMGGRINGSLYLANLSAVNAIFNHTRILANSALVFLLILSVVQLAAARTKNSL